MILSQMISMKVVLNIINPSQIICIGHYLDHQICRGQCQLSISKDNDKLNKVTEQISLILKHFKTTSQVNYRNWFFTLELSSHGRGTSIHINIQESSTFIIQVLKIINIYRYTFHCRNNDFICYLHSFFVKKLCLC